MSRQKADEKALQRDATLKDLGGDRQSGSRLSSVTAAVHLLKQFSEQNVELGISTLARNLGVSKSTVHRLASTLVAEGLLEQDPVSERYKLGLGLFTLGALVRQRLSVSAEAKGPITALRAEIEENVALAILNGDHITFLYDLESPLPVRVSCRLGLSVPALDCAEGIAILASRPNDALEAFFEHAYRTISVEKRGHRADEIEHVRRHGFAIKADHRETGAVCIAAPVYDATETVVAAIGVAAPSQRITAQKSKALAAKVVGTAYDISRRLGFVARSSHSA